MNAAIAPTVEPTAARRTSRSARHRPAWRRGAALAGLVVLGVWIVIALTLPWWSPHGPRDVVGPRLRPPGRHAWMGTDALGRDVLIRTLWGARTSLPVAVIVIAGAVLLGCLIGAVAGAAGGLTDAVLMRLVDITMAFPPVLLAMAITASRGPGIGNALMAMVLVWWPIYARLLRSQIVAVRHREFVESATAVGASPLLTLRRYILPMSFTPVLVNASMDLGQVVMLTAALSFIGLGARPPSPEWGAMITEGATNFYQWWIALCPGLAIVTVVLACNFVGDALRDTFDVRDTFE